MSCCRSSLSVGFAKEVEGEEGQVVAQRVVHHVRLKEARGDDVEADDCRLAETLVHILVETNDCNPRILLLPVHNAHPVSANCYASPPKIPRLPEEDALAFPVLHRDAQT